MSRDQYNFQKFEAVYTDGESTQPAGASLIGLPLFSEDLKDNSVLGGYEFTLKQGNLLVLCTQVEFNASRKDGKPIADDVICTWVARAAKDAINLSIERIKHKYDFNINNANHPTTDYLLWWLGEVRHKSN